MGQHEDQSGAHGGTGTPWAEIEAAFRLWSFRVYYDKLYATETNNPRRFVKALVASSQPIRDRIAVVRWYERRQRRRARIRGGRVDAAPVPT